jgi:hypothetical protein
MEVRDIIKEALSRANVVPRKQQANDAYVETALRLLQGITSRYNNQSLLAFTQMKARLPAARTIHIYNKEDLFAGEHHRFFNSISDLQNPLNIPNADDVAEGVKAMILGQPGTVYVATDSMPAPIWQARPFDEFDVDDQQMADYATARHVRIPNVQKLCTLFINSSPSGLVEQLQLSFLPLEDFDRASAADYVWTYTEMAEGEFIIRTKSYTGQGIIGLGVTYNRGFKVDINDDIRIPDAYLELLIVALTYALATTYPRLDDAQMERLAKELSIMETNVRTPKADTRMVKRERTYNRKLTAYDILAGVQFR